MVYNAKLTTVMNDHQKQFPFNGTKVYYSIRIISSPPPHLL